MKKARFPSFYSLCRLRSPPLCAHLSPCAARPVLYRTAAAGPPRAMNNERRGAAGSAGPRQTHVSVTEGWEGGAWGGGRDGGTGAVVPGVYGQFLEISCKGQGSGRRGTSCAFCFKKKRCVRVWPRVFPWHRERRHDQSSRRVPFFGLLSTILSALRLMDGPGYGGGVPLRTHAPAHTHPHARTLVQGIPWVRLTAHLTAAFPRKRRRECAHTHTRTHTLHRCCSLAQHLVRVVPQPRRCASPNSLL